MVKKTLLVASAALVLTATTAMSAPSIALAAHNDNHSSQSVAPITLPVTTWGQGQPGSEKIMSTTDVPNGEYKVHIKSMNQESVHPGTDMIVRSGNDQVEVKDVESEAFKEATADGTLDVQDGKVSLVVRIGEDGGFSGGMKVTLTKVTPPPVIPETPEEPEKPEVPETPEEPETPKEPKAPEAPKELPSTGPGAVVSAIIGTSALAGAGHAYLRSRRFNG